MILINGVLVISLTELSLLFRIMLTCFKQQKHNVIPRSINYSATPHPKGSAKAFVSQARLYLRF